MHKDKGRACRKLFDNVKDNIEDVDDMSDMNDLNDLNDLDNIRQHKTRRDDMRLNLNLDVGRKMRGRERKREKRCKAMDQNKTEKE